MYANSLSFWEQCWDQPMLSTVVVIVRLLEAISWWWHLNNDPNDDVESTDDGFDDELIALWCIKTLPSSGWSVLSRNETMHL